MKAFEQFCRDLVSVHYAKETRLEALGKQYVVNRTETDLLNLDTTADRLAEISGLLLLWMATHSVYSHNDPFFDDKIAGAKTFSSMLLQHPNRNR